MILKSPFSTKKIESFLPKKKSKSYWKLELSFGILIVDEPVPINFLFSKSNENPLTWCAVWPWIDVVDVVASFTLGLKSILSLKSNSPDGSLTSGSTLVAV